jgi:hypothetical protein
MTAIEMSASDSTNVVQPFSAAQWISNFLDDLDKCQVLNTFMTKFYRDYRTPPEFPGESFRFLFMKAFDISTSVETDHERQQVAHQCKYFMTKEELRKLRLLLNDFS